MTKQRSYVLYNPELRRNSKYKYKGITDNNKFTLAVQIYPPGNLSSELITDSRLANSKGEFIDKRERVRFFITTSPKSNPELAARIYDLSVVIDPRFDNLKQNLALNFLPPPTIRLSDNLTSYIHGLINDIEDMNTEINTLIQALVKKIIKSCPLPNRLECFKEKIYADPPFTVELLDTDVPDILKSVANKVRKAKKSELKRIMKQVKPEHVEPGFVELFGLDQSLMCNKIDSWQDAGLDLESESKLDQETVDLLTAVSEEAVAESTKDELLGILDELGVPDGYDYFCMEPLTYSYDAALQGNTSSQNLEPVLKKTKIYSTGGVAL